jgi:chromosomal replication initiator protein
MKISPYVFPGIRLKDLPKLSKIQRRSKIRPQDILKIVSEECGVTSEDILSRSRKGTIVNARHIFCAIMKKEFGYSYETVGNFVSGRDHTTAIHSIKTHKNRCETEEGYEEHTQLIINKIYSSY